MCVLLNTSSLSQIFEEQGQYSSPYQSGFGIQNVYGVPKPVYRSFQLLHQLHTDAVLVSTQGTVDVAVTLDTTSTSVKTLLVPCFAVEAVAPACARQLSSCVAALSVALQQSNIPIFSGSS